MSVLFQVGTIKSVMRFFDVKFNESTAVLAKRVKNKGKKNEVSAKTLKMLNDFFHPYNQRLASLLGDKKWLFEIERN